MSDLPRRSGARTRAPDPIVTPMPIELRQAHAGDAAAIAALHADSWRRHYRGAYSDAFLDGDVLADRLAAWSARLAETDPRRITVIAQQGGAVGFVHAVADEHPRWGSLIDNLHVTFSHKRSGIGRRLMGAAAVELQGRAQLPRVHLWVLEVNTAARAFYEALGGREVEAREVPPPGGQRERLCGSPVGVRCAWEDVGELIGG